VDEPVMPASENLHKTSRRAAKEDRGWRFHRTITRRGRDQASSKELAKARTQLPPLHPTLRRV